MLASLALAMTQNALPVVVVDRDDIEIRESCTLDCTAAFIVDDEGDGVVKVVGDGVTLRFTKSALAGSSESAAPDEYAGIGLRITARNVTVQGGRLQGFKAAIWASNADGLVLDGCDVSRNYRQHLRSTPRAEAGEDWLYPHHNDANEWLREHGTGIYVEQSRVVTVRNCTARDGQNGICLRAVDDSQVYDNDMSWLSGWGLALYRSSRNVVAHNSFDFCIRGYSHGVYARGQDSAGILCFEQSSDNIFAHNSATHGGDGFFGFAGSEALEGATTEKGLGCNRNLLLGNDFSYAAAIGIEMTFSYDNTYVQNRLVGSNYGVWGGYSGKTQVLGNTIEDNTLAGIAIEHGSQWGIHANRFARNARAIELWWDDDADLLAKPWAKLNPTTSTGYRIFENRFDGDSIQLELRGGTQDVVWSSVQTTDKARWRVDGESSVTTVDAPSGDDDGSAWKLRLAARPPLPGRREVVGALRQLEGRDKIIVTEWGPYDWVTPLLQRVEDRGAAHVWRLLGNDVAIGVTANDDVAVKLDQASAPPVFVLSARRPGAVVPYTLRVRLPSRELSGAGVLIATNWRVTLGNWQTDPRTDAATWRKEIEAGVTFAAPRLVLRFGSAGPSELADAPAVVKDAHFDVQRFGTLAATSIALPSGRWKIATLSDDGVRVSVDGALLIDNWTHHGPTPDAAEFTLAEPRTVALSVEHFELDGWAVLELELTPVP